MVFTKYIHASFYIMTTTQGEWFITCFKINHQINILPLALKSSQKSVKEYKRDALNFMSHSFPGARAVFFIL